MELRDKYLKTRLILGLLISTLVAAGNASASLMTEITSFPPLGETRWSAVYQIGGGSAPEMLLGDPANPPFPETADFAWTPDMQEPFSVVFDGSNLLTMTLGSGGAEQTLSLMLDSVVPPIQDDATELVIHVFASSQTTTGAGAPIDFTQVSLSDLELDGEALITGTSAFVGSPCAGLTPSPAPGTDCDFIQEFLRISGSDLTDGFTLTGMGNLNWGTGETPALDRLRWEVQGFVPLPEPGVVLLLAAGLAAAACARRPR